VEVRELGKPAGQRGAAARYPAAGAASASTRHRQQTTVLAIEPRQLERNGGG
jgi:hypothetical protein